VQVFNLAVLPGTAFRHEARELGLEFQSRPPYYVLKTPTLDLADLYSLMEEAEELFETEFDPLPAPEIPLWPGLSMTPPPNFYASWQIELDATDKPDWLPPLEERSQALTLWLRAADFVRHAETVETLVEQLLTENPHTTLQVILEPGDPRSITAAFLADLTRSCYRRTTYLDRFYSILPGPMKGSKRLVVLLDAGQRDGLDDEQIAGIGEFASIVWRGTPEADTRELSEHEYAL
jgi:hypothetical protein